jgi:hypothetical protein
MTRLDTDENGKIVKIGPHHSDNDGWLARLDDAFGTRGRQFSLLQLDHVLKLSHASNGQYDDTRANAILAAVDGLQPANEVEAMLAVQMAVTHELAMQALRRAQRVDQIPQYDSAAGMAVRLMRTFAAQAEALAKLQRGGEQVVRVVHVHPGGQAVIGNVQTSAGGGGCNEIGNQPHAKAKLSASAAAPMPALRSPDALPAALSLPGSEGQEALPHARRRAGQRRTAR